MASLRVISAPEWGLSVILRFAQDEPKPPSALTRDPCKATCDFALVYCALFGEDDTATAIRLRAFS